MKMTKTWTALFVFATLLASAPTGRAQSSSRVPASRIAEHTVARGLFAADGTAQVVGYLAFIDGVSGSLFSGAPSEATAFFAFRTDTISVQPIANGDITVFLLCNVYFNRSPHGDWNNPDSFSSGQLVATFTRTPPLIVNVVTMANSFFSAELTNSQEFAFNGETVDFKKLAPHGLTWLITATATLLPGAPCFVAAQPFVR
jgi:hypothetical protein